MLVPWARIRMIRVRIPSIAHMSMQATLRYSRTGMTSGRPECISSCATFVELESLPLALCAKPELCNLQGTCQMLKLQEVGDASPTKKKLIASILSR